jgi:hypothetical protein
MSLRKEDSILVLLGAGASAEAGIPVSREMIKKLEYLLYNDSEWEPYRDLYNFIKSAIYFADGIGGRFDNKVNYNIERLVNTLSLYFPLTGTNRTAKMATEPCKTTRQRAGGYLENRI